MPHANSGHRPSSALDKNPQTEAGAPDLPFLPLDAFTYVTLFISGRWIEPLTVNFCVIWYKSINFEMACLLRSLVLFQRRTR